MLKKYQSLSRQAEQIDTHEAYKEEIEIIRNLTYEELYNIIRDTETALKVLLRHEAKGESGGIKVLVERIMALGQAYLHTSYNMEYTYEFIEKEGREKKNV